MIKTKIYRLIEKGSHGNKLNRVFDYFIISLILLSAFTIIIESIPEINSQYSKLLETFNLFSIIVFSIEYVLRLYVSDLSHPKSTKFKSILSFIFSTQGLIDLLAVMPFYLPFLIKIDLRFLRLLRLTKFFRILKVNRYNNSLKLIGDVIKDKKPELAVTVFITFLALLFSSFIMYYVEGEKQPDKFPNILATFWWAVATLTTVGYGDVYPITGLGKLISGIIAVLGIGIVALPTGLISAGFISKIENRKQTEDKNVCPHCGKKNNEEKNHVDNIHIPANTIQN